MSNLLLQVERLVETLTKRKLFITTVESCTGGGMANSITNVSGASGVMLGARVTYSTEEKIALGISQELIEEHTVYSSETAVAMAEAGIKTAVRADIAVGITGSITRVDPANPGSKPGEVYIAVVFKDKLLSEKFIFADDGERWEIKERAIMEALKMVFEILE